MATKQTFTLKRVAKETEIDADDKRVYVDRLVKGLKRPVPERGCYKVFCIDGFFRETTMIGSRSSLVSNVS